ncbi:MAG: SHOCT domain-containing protein [Ignavibacteriaceae bacterium]
MYHNMFSGGMWFGWIFWIILVVVIVGLVVAMLNRSKSKIQYYPENDSPMDILKKRLAKGEINKEEYEQIKLKFK